MLKNELGNVLGIVAEYNPFHNGHKYQIDYCRKNNKIDTVVAVISGNFTQRGEPAILDKWNRAEMALKNGVDLVVELPFYYSCNGSKIFAKGGIKTLSLLGCINNISFGIEGENFKKLEIISDFLREESLIFSEKIKKSMMNGESYPKAVSNAIEDILGESYSELLTPNNLLAIEYMRYIKNFINSFQGNVNLICINRENIKHSSEKIDKNMNFASGKSIRNTIEGQKNVQMQGVEEIDKDEISMLCDELKMPVESGKILFKNKGNNIKEKKEILYRLLQYKMLSKSFTNSFGKILSEGMENLFDKHIRSVSIDEFIGKTVSKRYTNSRIQRAMIHLILNVDRCYNQADYIRVLGFNKRGSMLLRNIKKYNLNSAPIITNIKREDVRDKKFGLDMSLDIKATDIYNIISNNDVYQNSDFVKKPVIIGQQH